ncbi:hypothetical protein QBC34DRAFT_441523 [Podospora aff. communis PSN243]|uniref:Extracellular membrane protein CFEM domain-containing protein n=1 Tax=Podospora aff. communis PSN243 TaxID=3040156 RepID=A0AAV9GDF4_9PEZI|nr:hypothetical protein QBC34DRAFT_441523 [Podospora aff. communis PSN243]
MKTLRLFIPLFLLFTAQVQGADGPIDLSKAQGFGELRTCAHGPFVNAFREALTRVFGCNLISCICRPDLIPKVHDHIENNVRGICGSDATVDVQQSIRVYNDYCAANGFVVPGHTYISTQTVQVSTGLQNQPATGTAVATAGGPVGDGNVRTVTATVTALVAPVATAPSQSAGGYAGQLLQCPQALMFLVVLVEGVIIMI